MSKLANKVALVTGGSRGIGAAVAKRLAADGANVAITYAKDAKAASAVVKAIERAGQKAIAIQADAIDADAVAAAVEKTVATFGRLDVLVNNAGTAIPKAFVETTLEEMERVLDINVRGVFVATQAALKHMNEGGRIIMIGSAVGERAAAPGLVPYAATKGGPPLPAFSMRAKGGDATTSPLFQPFEESFGTVDLATIVPLLRRVSVQAGVKDLFDKNYQYTAGYPEAGRTGYVNLRWRF